MIVSCLTKKYRPQNLSEVVSHKNVCQVIYNAFEMSLLGKNSYVICGPYGTGKTTIARIIAKLLLCTSPVSFESCGNCVNCNLVKNSNHPDVIEIDAASHTGVDDIRQIINDAHYLPISSNYKIYIIDEAHMLSNSAFNALLKTMEEPPANVIFILATTEQEKIPKTIRSRCINFKLAPLFDLKEIKLRIKKIIDAENINCEDSAIDLLIKHSSGSMCDALMLLEQLAISCAGLITLDDAVKNLGIPPFEKLFDLMRLILIAKPFDALNLFKDLTFLGIAPQDIVNGLLEVINILVKIKLGFDCEKLSIAQDLYNSMKNISVICSNTTLHRLWQLIARGVQEFSLLTVGNLSSSININITIGEMLILRAIHISDAPQLDEIIKKVKNKMTESAKIESLKNDFNSFSDLLSLCKSSGNHLLYFHLSKDCNLLNFNVNPKSGDSHITIKIKEEYKNLDFPNQIKDLIKKYKNLDWIISGVYDENDKKTNFENKNIENTLKSKNLNPQVSNIIDVLTKNFGDQVEVEIVDDESNN